MLGLNHVASDDEVQLEKQRLASEWQRHQLVPPTPTPKNWPKGFHEERVRKRDTLRHAVAGVLGKVVSHIARFESSSPTMKKTDSTNTVSTADTDTSPGVDISDFVDDLTWWNLLPPDSGCSHFQQPL
jgi:hypothetical protein